jgi:DNA-binding LytR/AlgR family response regulator
MKTDNLICIGGNKKVIPKSILMLKADSNYTMVYLEDGSKIMSSTTMGILEKRLGKSHFFRPNRSVIINLEYVSNFEIKAKTGDYGTILLNNNTKIAVSRRKSADFQKIIL